MAEKKKHSKASASPAMPAGDVIQGDQHASTVPKPRRSGEATKSRERTAILSVSLLLLVVGAFYTGNILGSESETDPITAADIQAEAIAAVPVPVFPPKPAGREVVEKKTINTTVQVPVKTYDTIKIGGLSLRGQATTKMVKKTVPKTVEEKKLVDASPEEKAAWETDVKRIQDEYDIKVRAEEIKIARKRAKDDRDESVQLIRDIVKDTIVPLLAAVAGLIGAVAVFFRGTPAASK